MKMIFIVWVGENNPRLTVCATEAGAVSDGARTAREFVMEHNESVKNGDFLTLSENDKQAIAEWQKFLFEHGNENDQGIQVQKSVLND